LRALKNIIVLLAWLVVALLVSTDIVAAPFPQDSEKQKEVVSAKSNTESQGEERTEETRSVVNLEQDFSATSQHSLKRLPGDFLQDQREIWASPTKLRFTDTEWLVPLSGITAGLFVTDSDFNKSLSHDPKTINRYNNLSNASIAALIGGAGGMWLLSHETHNEHWRETGFLAGESALNSLAVVEGMKYSFGRQRPDEGNGNGQFFHGGTSFPSEHAAAAWSVAGVVAHEYPGTFTKILVYGLASLVDVSRMKAQKHFPSDVLVGTVIGNLVAQNIYSRHHDPGLGGEAWRSISQIFRGDGTYSPANQGSPYVPLDSWIYPALDRLAAMGLIDSGFAGMRPWTRNECVRLLGEAEDKLSSNENENSDVAKLVASLEREFHGEIEEANASGNTNFRLESVYARTEHISGMPLTDGYDFAQTQINDFGRPFGEGWGTAIGFSTYITAGRWVGYFRGEWQTAPSIPALSLTARETIQNVDSLPLPPATPTPSISRFQLLDAYVGLAVSNWQVSFGRQSLYWGSGHGGSLDLSNNAQPINMFRINRTMPLKLPKILSWLGPMRTEFFLGQLAGFEFIDSPLGLVGQWGQALPRQPFIHGQNLSFKPTRNFEFGFYRTTIFGGEGYPFTMHRLIASMFDTGNAAAGAGNKPGNRTSGLDFSYRLPYLRNWVTLYGDGYTDDEFSPIAYVNVSAWHAGLFLSHFPRVSRLDLRVEGVYTDIPGGTPINTKQPGSFYSNGTWRSGYTNNGDLIGSWVGRGGQGAQAWSNYWLSPRNRLQFNFRHQKVSQEFIPGGGTLTDAGVRTDYWFAHSVGITASVQYEKWLFPVIQLSPARNVSASVEVQFQPQKVFQPLFNHVLQNSTGGQN